jgi:hypothetical protein
LELATIGLGGAAVRDFDLSSFAAHLGNLAAGITAAERVLLDRAARVIEAEARRVIGQHQNAVGSSASGEGDLLDSIEHTVLTPCAHVGSNLPEAEAREFGGPTNPPQSFLSGSAFRKATDVCDLIGDSFSNYLAGAKS